MTEQQLPSHNTDTNGNFLPKWRVRRWVMFSWKAKGDAWLAIAATIETAYFNGCDAVDAALTVDAVNAVTVVWP